MNPTHHTDHRDVLHVTPADLRDTIRVTSDRELIAELDRRRAGVPGSECLEMVLGANLPREHPQLPDDWTPESAGERRLARAGRYLETGR